MVNAKVAPFPFLLFSAHIFPPWASTIFLEMNNPRLVTRFWFYWELGEQLWQYLVAYSCSSIFHLYQDITVCLFNVNGNCSFIRKFNCVMKQIDYKLGQSCNLSHDSLFHISHAWCLRWHGIYMQKTTKLLLHEQIHESLGLFSNRCVICGKITWDVFILL